MLRIFLPIAFLLIVSTVRKIPKIGGNVGVAFFGAGLIAFVMGGVFDLSTWASAWFAQVKTFAFSIFVLVFGSIYAKMLIKSGTLDALLNVFRAAFGKTARGLVAVVLLVLWITGALIGNVTAVATLVGVLVIPLLADIGMSANMICAVILSGAALGALQPPVSSAINMALSLMQMEDITDTMNLFYVTIPIGIVLVILFFIFVYVNPKKHSISPELLPTEKAGAIFRRTWKSFISVFVLFGFAVLASFPGVKLDIMGNLLKTIAHGTFYQWLGGIPILSALRNYIVLDLLAAMLACVLLSREVRANLKECVTKGAKAGGKSILMLLGAAFFVGAFNVSGQVATLNNMVSMLSEDNLKICGTLLIVLSGMLIGSCNNIMSVFFPIMVPALIGFGLPESQICVALTMIAFGGQGMPPYHMAAFLVSDFVGNHLGKKVNPEKVMVLAMPYPLYLVLCGLMLLYI